MQSCREQGENPPSQCSTEDDMTEGDLGDGMGARSSGHHDKSHLPQIKSRENFLDFQSQSRHLKRGSEGSNAPFSWTSFKAMYNVLREEMEGERAARWQKRLSESSSEETSEELQRRLQEVTEEVELLRTELEITHRHLEGKHEALRILQAQEVNALQWEITFNQVQFKNVENSWSLTYERVLAENEALKKALEERMTQHRKTRAENASLSQKCLELLSMFSAKERRDFQRTQPTCSLGTDGSALELAVYGACQCNSNGGEPCPCARSAAASRKQVLQLKQELEQQQKRKEEAYVMMDAFRIAFEQQLRRVSENVLRQAETDRHQPHDQRHERGKQGSLSDRLKKILPAAREGKIPTDSKETLNMVLDLVSILFIVLSLFSFRLNFLFSSLFWLSSIFQLNDKEEALAHQRKVSYMLARNTEDLEKRLQMQLDELGLSHKDTNTNIEASEKSDWSRERDCRCSTDSCGSQHFTVPENLAADAEQSSKPN
ncbi:coiled-coil domain-containing protein 125 isoform X2 [Myxocyprinus asiaticus]|uniref:coiled-coil domain-containing protein 125 isoform X2 n=1 Tax=Myxocyprinus asiaticus TaxID=70543 RepID=UPI002221EDD4|nr:coiled-coil domain-containing protein 125 isoform X2 [Myxocyprinus asiaticus]